MNAATELLAWEVEIQSMRCICFATTKAKAQWLATKAYWEAFDRRGWPGARAKRAEHHDKSVLRFHQPQKAWSEDHVLSSSTTP